MPPATATAVHPVAEAGFGGAGLTAYEAARPSYPPEAIEHCIDRLGLRHGGDAAPSGGADKEAGGSAGPAARGAGAPAPAPPPGRPRVLDLAAGTGKLTRQLDALGMFDLAAAEPSEGMCGALRRACPGVPVARAEAARLPYAGGEFDAVFVGQAFHWFATPEACAEVRRVLKPGGGLALLWNLEDASQPWMREFLDIFQPYARQAAVPNYGLGTHVEALESPWFAELFDVSGGAASCSRLFRSRRPLTREGAWLRVLSNSFVASLPEEVREGEARRAVAAWAARHAARFGAAGADGSGRGGGGVGEAAAAGGGGGGGGGGGAEQDVALFEHVTEAFVCRRR